MPRNKVVRDRTSRQDAVNPSYEDRAKLFCLALLVVVIVLFTTSISHGARPPGIQRKDFMDCEGAVVCGVLTLESGLGTGAYRKWPPSVHGLWPQVSPYGNSACMPPLSSSAEPNGLATCFDNLGFQAHEWRKHGICAGTKDAHDFFSQVCRLAAQPLRVMQTAGPDFQAQLKALQAVGLHIFNVDTRNWQFQLSACAGCDGVWTLAPPSQFTHLCSGNCRPVASSGPACWPNRKGPPCMSDKDCSGLANCVRCARSGFCTDIPYPQR